MRALRLVGLPGLEINIGQSEQQAAPPGRLELPGYHRPKKKWDMMVLSSRQLVAALEFKN